MLSLRRRRRRRMPWVPGAYPDSVHDAVKRRAERTMEPVDEQMAEVRAVLGATNDIGLAQQLVAAGVKSLAEAEGIVARGETLQVIAASQTNRMDIPEVGTLQRKPRRMRDGR